MNTAEIESKLHDLKVKQADIMKKKKADRDNATLTAIREEMNKLKGDATALYKGKK